MLKQRVITALVLLAILLPALFSTNTLIFGAVVLLMVTAAAWEWGRLNHLGQKASVATAILMLLAGVATWKLGGLAQNFQLLWLVVGAFWVLASAALVRGGVGVWTKIPWPIRWVAGFFVIWAAGLAMVQARQIGINFLLSILMLVWVADIFAYFAGRTWGLRFTKVKLAPSISPGKSWEGAWGGVFGVVALSFAWVAADQFLQPLTTSFYSRLFQQGWWVLGLAALFMAAMSVVGDLVESLIKRSAGVKDSSQLLPGHGGILDRIDALLPILPLAMMLNSMVQ